MELKSVTIKNYRSIEEITFDISRLADGSYTYGLIGINEVGKSTILKALALKDGLKNSKGEKLPLFKDFRHKEKPIEVEYLYALAKFDLKEIEEHIKAQSTPIEISEVDFSTLKYTASFESSDLGQTYESVEVLNLPADDANKETIEEQIRPLISKKIHSSIFWTAEDRYLISQPINLVEFSEKPKDISIPLKNCFALAGVVGQEEIKKRIALISDSTEREQLKNDLGAEVTKHINNAWPGHPIKITFDISDGFINFHVHDSKAKAKAKTADQRSDGFGQFVSFLLTVSAQNKNEELSNSILLLDEPETHLHPTAQEDLLKEIVSITQNNRNNIAFFATHSNHMIDKADLSRNYKVLKPKDQSEKQRFDQKASTYASVAYEVFDIASTDYHNELYGKLHETYQDLDQNDQNRVFIKNFDDNFLKGKGLKQDKPYKGKANNATLPTYIRTCIAHSENGNTYTEKELRTSIELLRTYL